MTLPICERLLAERWLRNDKHGNSFYEDINPDGPEAADLIETLVEALHELTALAERFVYPQPDKPHSDWAKVERANAALALARGENTPGSEEMK